MRRRARQTAPTELPRPRPKPARALTEQQEKAVLDLLHEPRFAYQAPAEIYAALLDEDRYHCSIRTMYRLLHKNKEVRERRAQRRHPTYTKPELLAERPNEVLPQLLRLVQPGPPPQRHWADDTRPGAFWPGRCRPCRPLNRPQLGSTHPSRSKRTKLKYRHRVYQSR
jgi:hypothetical protein